MNTKRNTSKTNLLQGQDLLLLPFIQGLALALQGLSLLLHPHHLVLQPVPLVVQVPDGCFLGHLGGLQAADLTYERTERTGVRTQRMLK